MKTRTVVFIHGMFMTSACWEGWKGYFEGKGYRCLAPNWPGRDAPVDTLRRAHPDPALGKLNLTRVVEYHADLINKLEEKPVIIGHSMGALVTQILVNRGLGAAGVAIDSAPPVGVFTPAWSFLKANFPMIDPFVSKNQPHLMTFPQFQYAFVNSLPLAKQQAAYERYVVPESRQVPQESLLGSIARIDFKKAHAPLLLTAGSIDHIIPASLNRTNYARYGASRSVADFKEFPGRTHFLIGQKGWEEIAGYVSSWLEEKGV
jgi:pimeloyl-ACP methyl ester carboxylesterase